MTAPEINFPDPIAGMKALSRVAVSMNKRKKRRLKKLVGQGRTKKAQKLILEDLERECHQQNARNVNT